MAIQNLFKPKEGEKIEMVKRRHPFTFVPQILLFIGMVGFPPIMERIVFQGGIAVIENPLAQVGAVLLMSAYYLGAILFLLGLFVDYYLDITIVTNDRIIDIEQKGIFGRQISELDLSRIQDVNSEIKGILPTLFNFGIVEVQTAGDEAMFEFQDTPHPHKVRQRIIELSALDRKREAREMHKVAQEGKMAAAGEPEDPLHTQGL